MNEDKIYVNMTEIKVASSPKELVCLGLGSCIAVIFYDAEKKLGGIAHVMLPDSRGALNITHPGKFADTAVPSLLKKMIRKGANKNKIQAKIFGGANMFSVLPTRMIPPIGDSNVDAILNELKKHKIYLKAKDTGGNEDRSIFFDVSTGTVLMKTAKNFSETVF